MWGIVRDTDDIHAVVLRANGERAFCTGIDVTEGVWWYHLNIWNQADPGFLLGPKAHKCWKPVVAAVHGMCAGGGQYFVNESDIIICSDDATFFDPHATRGIVSALEPIGMLHRNVPLGDVLRWALLGTRSGSPRRPRCGSGIVTEIVPREELRSRAHELAAEIAARAPRRSRARCGAIWESLDMTRTRRCRTASSTPTSATRRRGRSPAWPRSAARPLPLMASVWDQRLGFWWIAEDHPDRPPSRRRPTVRAPTPSSPGGRTSSCTCSAPAVCSPATRSPRCCQRHRGWSSGRWRATRRAGTSSRSTPSSPGRDRHDRRALRGGTSW